MLRVLKVFGICATLVEFQFRCFRLLLARKEVRLLTCTVLPYMYAGSRYGMVRSSGLQPGAKVGQIVKKSQQTKRS